MNLKKSKKRKSGRKEWTLTLVTEDLESRKIVDIDKETFVLLLQTRKEVEHNQCILILKVMLILYMSYFAGFF